MTGTDEQPRAYVSAAPGAMINVPPDIAARIVRDIADHPISADDRLCGHVRARRYAGFMVLFVLEELTEP